MTIKGKLEVVIAGGKRASGEYFVSLYNFLNGLSSIGVTRIASNYGTAVSGFGGNGFGYWDTSPNATPGSNAWAVFRFGSAQVPFNVLIQVQNINNTTGGTALGSNTTYTTSMGVTSNLTTMYGNLISVAQRADGVNPWNGGTANVGADAKNAIVWQSGSLPTQSLLSYPRVNSDGGALQTTRTGCMPLNVVYNNNSSTDANSNVNDIWRLGSRSHFLADENNLLILDDTGLNGSYKFFYFGKYQPINKGSGFNPTVPYVCLNHLYPAHDPAVPKYQYGSTAQLFIDFTTQGDGGIAHPNPTKGVKTVYLDYITSGVNYVYLPNRTRTSSGQFEMFPVYLGMNDAPHLSVCGVLDFFKVVGNIPPNFMHPGRKLAFLQGSNTATSGKIAVPWDGLTAPGSGRTREGIDF